MNKIAMKSLESFKKRAAAMRPFTKDQTHGQALDLLAKLCGYSGYNALKSADITQGNVISLNDVVARILKLCPSVKLDQAFNAATKMNLHTVGVADKYPRVLKSKDSPTSPRTQPTERAAAPRAAPAQAPAQAPGPVVTIKKTRRIILPATTATPLKTD